ncbi:hypothetical protein [Devosia sp. SL43]|uniref:hypothetical protein n=1 Tax=Devosia sp. SL43 TaxID=2806348 RepID=UPI001F39C64A|nr:hypothetical protein [Devosia sp. SL43]UJW87289.1 hypothetical protein IM737_08655 [Devosia sp. SL43]
MKAALLVRPPSTSRSPSVLSCLGAFITRRPLQNLERIAMVDEGFKVIVQAEQRMRGHDDAQ